MKMNAFSNIKNIVLLALVGLGLTACGGDMADLDKYIIDVKARPKEVIEGLPEITPYESYAYTAAKDGLRSPFVPDTPQAVSGGSRNLVRPKEDRSREFLEQFPLDTLRMVGTLELGETNYGLVQTADGLIHRVVPGNYVGQNDGRITAINESEIKLVEIISDGIGGYLEREAAVGLSD